MLHNGVEMSFGIARKWLKQVPSKEAAQLWIRGALSSETNNRYPAQLYSISQDGNYHFNHHLWNTIRNAQSVRINKNQRLLRGTWAEAHEKKKLIKNCLLKLIRCLFRKKNQGQLFSKSLHHLNVCFLFFFCHSGNNFLMTLVHNWYRASVVRQGESQIFLPKGSLTVS